MNKTAPTVEPLPADKALDAFFLEARARVLDLAAILDRIGRGRDAAAVANDPRFVKLLRGLELVHDRTEGRAEAVQQLFSLEYDPNWVRPKPR